MLENMQQNLKYNTDINFFCSRVPKIIIIVKKKWQKKILLSLLIFQYYFNFLVPRNKIWGFFLYFLAEQPLKCWTA